MTSSLYTTIRRSATWSGLPGWRDWTRGCLRRTERDPARGGTRPAGPAGVPRRRWSGQEPGRRRAGREADPGWHRSSRAGPDTRAITSGGPGTQGASQGGKRRNPDGLVLPRLRSRRPPRLLPGDGLPPASPAGVSCRVCGSSVHWLLWHHFIQAFDRWALEALVSWREFKPRLFPTALRGWLPTSTDEILALPGSIPGSAGIRGRQAD